MTMIDLDKENMAQNRDLRILAISGSARKLSFNTALIEAAKEVAPEDMSISRFNVSGFLLFSVDIEFNPTNEIQVFKENIRLADAILFASPEYNYSVTAVMKNAIEWGNRPENFWSGKPAAIISATTGPRGGVRSQLHLRQIMVDLNMHPINRPQVLVGNSREKFDSNLNLQDEATRKALRELLEALKTWTLNLRGRMESTNS